MLKTELTGKRRYRQVKIKLFFGKPVLVLQVEERVHGYSIDCYGGVIDGIDVDYKIWRDATVEDLTRSDVND